MFLESDLNECSSCSNNYNFLINIIKYYNVKNIDFLACHSILYTAWNKFYNVLNKETGVIIGANNNKTGNIAFGGDWIMKNTNENIFYGKNGAR